MVISKKSSTFAPEFKTNLVAKSYLTYSRLGKINKKQFKFSQL